MIGNIINRVGRIGIGRWVLQIVKNRLDFSITIAYRTNEINSKFIEVNKLLFFLIRSYSLFLLVNRTRPKTPKSNKANSNPETPPSSRIVIKIVSLVISFPSRS